MSFWNKLLQRFYRWRKRRLFVLLAIFLVIVILAGSLLALTGLFGSRSELCSLKISKSAPTTQRLLGTGINLDYIPLTNMIGDSSFESTKRYTTFQLADIGTDCVYISSEEALNPNINSENLIGSTARIYSINERGDMVLGVESTIVDYDQFSFGTFEEVPDTNWFWTQDRLVDIFTSSTSIFGITESGAIVTDIDSEELSNKMILEDDCFVKLASNGIAAMAISKRGDLYYSPDCKRFSLVAAVEEGSSLSYSLQEGAVTIEDLAMINGSAVVALSDGTTLISNGTSMERHILFDRAASKLCSLESKIIAILDDNSIYSSSNGLIFKEETELNEVVGDRNIISITSFGETLAVFVEDDAALVVNQDITELNLPSNTDKINLINDFEILAHTSEGMVYLVGKDTFTMLNSPEQIANDVFGVNGKILLQIDTRIVETGVLGVIIFDSVIPDSAIYPGDVCYVEKDEKACMASIYLDSDNEEDYWKLGDDNRVWDVYGNKTSATTVEGAPAGYGNQCARLLGSSDDIHVLSQVIASRGDQVFRENEFLRLELQLKRENMSDGEVKIWLSSEGCEDIGFVIQDVGSKFKSYSYVFVPSDDFVVTSSEIRLNISFEGYGELLVDGVYLGPDKYSASSIPNEFKDAITSAKPNVIRLNNLGFGSVGVSYSALFSNSLNSSVVIENNEAIKNCSSLEDSLRLVKDSDAYPWLVVGSTADSSSVSALMEYICGSLSSEYGRIRIDNGTAVPWSRQFENIIIEINDEDGLLLTDIQKAAYVNYITSLIKQSDYYTGIKGNIVFVDGMDYSGGVMLSNADYHSTSYSDNGVYPADTTYINLIGGIYEDINTSTPKVNSYATGAAELMSSMDMSGYFASRDIKASECIATLLSEKSSFAQVVLINLKMDCNNPDYSKIIDDSYLTLLRSIRILQDLEFSDRILGNVQKPLAEDSKISLETFQSDVGMFLFKTDSCYCLVVANVSNEQQQYLVDGVDVVLEGAEVRRYSAEGEFLQSSTFSKRNKRQTIQSGQVILYMIPLA